MTTGRACGGSFADVSAKRSTRGFLWRFVWFSLGMLVTAGAALAQERPPERRVALIIGNSNYRTIPKLKNPVADAAEMQKTLHALRFELIVGQDLTLEGFRSKVEEFTKALKNADIGLLFYAGHGVQYRDQNYLLPTDIELSSEAEVVTKSMPLNEILESIGRMARSSVIFLDACRDSPQFQPLARSAEAATMPPLTFQKGLAMINTPPNLPTPDRFVGYAAAPGKAAEDGRGKNSPFTQALLRHVRKTDADIQAMFVSVTADVLKATANRQKPESVVTLTRPLKLNPSNPGAAEPAEAASEEATPGLSASAELEFWIAIKDTSDPHNFEDYLKLHPKGKFVVLAKRKLDELKAQAKIAEVRPQPVPASLPTPANQPLAGDLGQSFGMARISKGQPKEEAMRGARALARATAIVNAVQMPDQALPPAVTGPKESARLLGLLTRGIPHDEAWTTQPSSSPQDLRVELRAKVRILPPDTDRRISGKLERDMIETGQPLRFMVQARKDATIGVFSWQANGTVVRLYPESSRSQIVIKAGESVWFPRKNDPYPAISSGTMPDEPHNHEAFIIVTGSREIAFDQLVPYAIAATPRHAAPHVVQGAEFLTKLAAVSDPELEVLVLPYEVVAPR